MKALITKDGLNCIPVDQIDNISINELSIYNEKVYGIYIKAGSTMFLYDRSLEPKEIKETFIGLVNKLYGEENVIREDLMEDSGGKVGRYSII